MPNVREPNVNSRTENSTVNVLKSLKVAHFPKHRSSQIMLGTKHNGTKISGTENSTVNVLTSLNVAHIPKHRSSVSFVNRVRHPYLLVQHFAFHEYSADLQMN
ncbi:unnamed protein product [Dicrocoelium dendriticum]|nr:unnamed protein product [Dicrocoelium dendriticum]